MNNITLIFSKDRALQLDAVLRSFLLHCLDAEQTQIRVLYAVSSPLHAEQYKQLETEYQRYPFIQFVSEKSFRSDLLALLAPADYVLFLVDDNIFIKDFSIKDIIENLENQPVTLGFSLRLGKNTTYCYTLNKPQLLPDFFEVGNKTLLYDWTHAECDFNYPLEVSSSVYRTEDILPFIAQLPFSNPNTLEALMANNKSAFQKEKPFLLCYEQSMTFCAPLNIVQTAWPNRVSTKIDYSPENLAQLFSEGFRIDASAYSNFVPNACHQEVELKFIDGKGQGSVPAVAQHPSVSIIILNYNGLEDIKACLDSIRRNTPEDHEIIVVDNASTDGSVEYLRSLSHVNLIENKTNIGCPPARAQALTLAMGDYVVFLDNDTVVTKGWITRFIQHAKAYPQVGLIGPRSNYVSGMQLVPEAKYHSIDELEKFAGDFSRQNQGQLTLAIRLVGFCIFIRREVIERIGGIDASFGKFGFEDDDYTWRATVAGFKAAIANDVFIHHTGGPQGRGDSNYNQLLLDAWEVFKRKWQLPHDLQYGTHCSPDILRNILNRPFDPQKHYAPLPEQLEVEKLVYKGVRSEAVEKARIPAGKEDTGLQIIPVKDMVSIVIPVSKELDNMKECIKSIRKYTPETHEILFVPVDSSHAHIKRIRKLLKEYQNCRLIESNPPSPPLENGGISGGLEKGGKGGFIDKKFSYPQSCNIGINESIGEHIVLLSDDIIVTEGWLSGMLEHLNSAPDTGIVSPMTVNVDGPQGVRTDCRGLCPRNDKIADELYEFAKEFRERNRYRRIASTNLNGFCMLFRKELTKTLGLMDERLDIPDFADNDYCLRAAAEGYRNLIAGDVFVNSRRNRTLAGRPKDFMDRLSVISKLFFEKWNNLDPASPLGKRVYVLNALASARELSQKGQRDEAIRVLQDSQNISSDDRRSYYLLAEILIEDKRFRQALEVLENMPETPGEDSARFELMGRCEFFLTNFKKAAQYAGKALLLNGSFSNALVLKGLIAYENNNHDEAEKLFRNAMESDRGYGDAYYRLGLLKQETNKEEAFDLLEHAFILSPEDEDIIKAYTDAAMYLSHTEKAEKIMREAAALYPSHKRLKYALADILMKQSGNHEAMHILEDVLLECGIDNETLNLAVKVRESLGPKEIQKDMKKNSRNSPLTKGDKGGCKTYKEEKSRKQPPAPPLLRGNLEPPLSPASLDYATISLCMIVKDEEKNIGNCLRKIRPVVDEMIVVDTGSSDRTKDIAKAFGAKVFDFKWTNNFSEARNFSISKASGKWILVLDADEVISQKDYESLKQFVTPAPEKKTVGRGLKGSRKHTKESPFDPSSSRATSSFRAYSFVTRNYTHNVSIDWSPNDGRYLEEEAGTGWTTSLKVRLFPNDARIQFSNPVHELVEDSLRQAGIRIEKIGIPVHHYGNLDREKTISKRTDYYELGRTKLDQKGEQDIQALYEMATQASTIGKYEEALEYWKKLTETSPNFVKGFIGLASLFCNLGKYEDAVSAMQKAMALTPDSSDVITFYTICKACAGDVETAISPLEDLLDREPMQPLALCLLAAAYFCSNRKKEGFFHAKKLHETNIDASGLFQKFAKQLIEARQYNFASSLLEAAAEGNYITSETRMLLNDAKAKKNSENRRHGDSVETIMTKEISESGNSVSLIILASEKGYVGECVKAVKTHTPEPLEVLLVQKEPSDALNNRLKKLAEENKDFKLVTNTTDKFSCAIAYNLGIKASSGRHIVFLEDDVIVTDGWLTGLLEIEMNSPDAGLIGPMMNNTDKPQGVEGLAEFPDPKAIDEYASAFRQRNRYRRISFRKLRGSCLLGSRAVFEKTGLFDEKFTTPEYAVEDYCLRTSLDGYKNFIAGDVFVHHRKGKAIDARLNTSGMTDIADAKLNTDMTNFSYSGFQERHDSLLNPSFPQSLSGNLMYEERISILENNRSLFADRKIFIDKWGSIDIDSAIGKNLFAVNALELSDELGQKGQKQSAIAALLEGIKYAPDDASLHVALVECLIVERNFRDALEIIDRMPLNMKKDTKIIELTGYCKEGLGLYTEAQQQGDRAISLNGSSANAWNLKGIASFKTGLFNDAEKFFLKALEFDPGLGETHANLGALKWNSAKQAEALDLFEKAFILSPADENIVFNFHAASAALARLDRAEQVLKDASAICPSNKKIKYTLVDVLLQQEKYEEAMHVFEDTMIAFGIDNDTLALALGIREKIGPKEITKNVEKNSNNSPLTKGDKGGCKTYNEEKSKKQPPTPPFLRGNIQTPASLNSASISLCMIVKNEENNIAGCLHSISPMVDEMIVVDTGSTDKTKDIARAFGARVYDFEWKNDFSEARNFSLSKASGAWIIALDADEVIAPFDQKALKNLLGLPEYKSTAFTITTRNYVRPVSFVGWRANDGSYLKEEAGTGWLPSVKVRIFPNNPHIRFESPVHEFVELSLRKAGIRDIPIDIPVHHYGKLKKEKTQSKGEDYYILQKLKLSERGTDDFMALYEIAVQAMELERYDEALQYWKKLTELKPNVPKAFFGLASSLYQLGRFQEAFDASEKALYLEKDENEIKEIVNLYTSCALSLGRAESAIPQLEKVLHKTPDYPMARMMVSLAYCAVNNKETAKINLERLRTMRMPFDDYLNNFAEFLMSAGRPEYALRIIETALEMNTKDGRFPLLLERCRKILEGPGTGQTDEKPSPR